MDKLILRKIAKEWCKGILMACEGDAFGEAIDNELITEEEVNYVVKESHKIAERITKEPQLFDLTKIIEKYYDFK